MPFAYKDEHDTIDCWDGTEAAGAVATSTTFGVGPATLVGAPIIFGASTSLRIHIPKLTIRSAPFPFSEFALARILNI